MTDSRKISIAHFSDMLCIWAYIAQIRVDELKSEFGPPIDLQYHFLPVFGGVEEMMEKNWSSRGGIEAYNKHVLNMSSRFDHIQVHPDIWLKNTPTSSIGCHLFLKALQLLEADEEIDPSVNPDNNKTLFEQFVWNVRLAFFRDLKDISHIDTLLQIAEDMDLPVHKIQQKINTGLAYAALDQDHDLQQSYNVTGSPTLVFNEGRQIIYGNVGYRVIEANIRELLSTPGHQASWC